MSNPQEEEEEEEKLHQKSTNKIHLMGLVVGQIYIRTLYVVCFRIHTYFPL
jgi:hypothetical protein